MKINSEFEWGFLAFVSYSVTFIVFFIVGLLAMQKGVVNDSARTPIVTLALVNFASVAFLWARFVDKFRWIED